MAIGTACLSVRVTFYCTGDWYVCIAGRHTVQRYLSMPLASYFIMYRLVQYAAMPQWHETWLHWP
jgi:hypothetical protein